MKALKEINLEIYRDLAQNGARILFDLDEYRVLDGVKDDGESYFLKDFSTERWFLIDLKTCYSLITCFHCGGDLRYLKELIEEIIYGEMAEWA